MAQLSEIYADDYLPVLVLTADRSREVRLRALESGAKDFASKPFDMEQIESVLHQIELSQKYQSTRFGLGLASSLFPAWIHNGKLNALHDLFIHSSTLQPILLR